MRRLSLSILAAVLLICGCSVPEELSKERLGASYYRQGSDIFYHDYDEAVHLKDADANSFEPLKFDFARDKDTVFWKKHPIKIQDISSFEPLNYWLTKDKFQIYERVPTPVDEPAYQFIARPEIDLDSLEVFNGQYAKDKNKIYTNILSRDSLVEQIDVASFEVLRAYCYTRDVNHIYSYTNSEIITEADPTSFEMLGVDCYAKDKNHVYYDGKIVEKFDAASFKILTGKFKSCDYRIYLDKNAVFYFDEEIEGADPATFELVEGDNFAKDKNYSYQFVGDIDYRLGPCSSSIKRVDLR